MFAPNAFYVELVCVGEFLLSMQQRAAPDKAR